MADSIDKERGSSIHAAAHPASKVGPHPVLIAMFCDCSEQLRGRKVERIRKFHEEGFA